MHFALLDPGLQNLAGHHLDLDRRVIAELKVRGHKVSVFPHRKIDDQAISRLAQADSVRPFFRHPPYRNPSLIEPNHLNTFFDPVSGPLAQFVMGAESIAEDLSLLEQFDGWLWPSLFAGQLLACAKVSPRVPVAGCIHVEPGFDSPMGRVFWRYAFSQSMAAGLRLEAGALTPELAAEYSALSPETRIQQWPLYFDGEPLRSERQQLLNVGFFGHQRRQEKGYALISSLVSKLLDQGFLVTVQDSGNSIQPGSHERLKVLGYLDDFGQAICNCDLIVVPYHPESYRSRGSGIVWEAIASGIPVVAPSNTAPGNLIFALGSGRLFSEFSAESIFNAIQTALADYPVISTMARSAAHRWARTQGIRHFVDCLLHGL